MEQNVIEVGLYLIGFCNGLVFGFFIAMILNQLLKEDNNGDNNCFSNGTDNWWAWNAFLEDSRL